MINEICFFFLRLTAIYFACIYFVYATLIFFSWLKLRRKRNITSTNSAELPPVSFIVPAYNEESLIVETIQTYLSLPVKKEIIVIDDGSHDSTMQLLKVMYQLRLQGAGPYRSITHPELQVLSASHMGKAQAMNFGVAHASYDIVCTMDADTVPSSAGVEACLRAFAQDSRLISAGGIIQVLQGRTLINNTPGTDIRPGKLTSFQRIEYLRTFLCERLGWSFLRSTLLISGAFCMVKKSALKEVGGFRYNSITEDFDLILRLRRRFHNFKFRILPVTTCYTQVPNTLKHLKRQRIRWQLGLVESLSRNMSMLFNVRYGNVGMLALPYYWFVEVLSPVIEFAALIMIPVAMVQGLLEWNMVLSILTAGVALNVFFTCLGVYLDERYVSGKRSWSYITAIAHATLVHLGYKQLNAWWRLVALALVLSKKYSWGEKPREEIVVIQA